MNAEIDYAAETKLPAGKTCDDCANAKRCLLLGYTSPGAVACDFYPSRYRDIVPDRDIG